jgi:DNA-binding transcriptional LysR family regulator
MNRIALYHIETLLWIDRLGTFAATAQRLNTTQPAISARVRELEGHLGAALFKREGRVMTLTPVGRQLVREFGPIWSHLQDCLLNCAGFEEATGIIRIGAGEIAAASCLPGFVAGLTSEMPAVSLEIEIELTANLILQLINGRTDIAFTAGAIAHPALRASSIGAVNLLWLASPPVAAAMEGDHRKVPKVWSLSDQSPLYQVMREATRLAGIPPSSVNLCNNVRAMIDIVAAGCGIGLFPQPMVDQPLATGALVPIGNMSNPPPVEFHIAIRAAEIEPLVLEIYRRATLLEIGQRHSG